MTSRNCLFITLVGLGCNLLLCPRYRTSVCALLKSICVAGTIIIASQPGRVHAQESEQATTSNPSASNAVDADQLRAIEAKYRHSLVLVACVSNKQTLAINEQDTDSLLVSPAPLSATDPKFVANRYATAFVLTKEGHFLVPYSALGDPSRYVYFVWANGFSAHATLTPMQAELVVGEPYTNLAVLHVLDERFAERLTPIIIDESTEPKLGETCYRVSCGKGFSESASLTIEPGTVTGRQNSVVNPSLLTKDRDNSVEKATIYAHGGTFQTNNIEYVDACGSAIVSTDGTLIGMSIDCLESNLMRLNGSYALPADRTFKRVAKSLQKGKLPEFGFLGIQPSVVDPILQRRNLRGTLVAGVIEGMPGEQAGLKIGDVITQVGQKDLYARDDVFRELAGYAPGEAIELTVRRPRGPDILFVDTTVRLTKRYVATQRPAYSKEQAQQWNGVTVDYATAFPPDLLFQYYSRYAGFDPKAIAVMDVQLGSKAWEAGLRVGNKVIAVNGRSVDSPEKFYQLVAASKTTKISTQDLQGRISLIEIDLAQ